MKAALVAVLGHVDHGKSALVRALTGTETDRLPEERTRGISIALGFARLALPDGAELDLVDVPGHERFVRTMVAGATAMRAALLVVDAAEGVRPQTVEHAEIAMLLGVRRGVVAVARADRAGPDQAAAAAAAARAMLRGLGLGDWPVVVTSAITGAGLPGLVAALAPFAAAPDEAEAGAAWLPVDRVFTLAGAGTVVTGALRRGRLALEDMVDILPSGRPARVRGLQSHGRAVAEVQAGRRVAVALRGVDRDAIAPGDALAAPGLLAASVRLDARVVVLASAPRAIGHGEALRLLLGTTEAGARLHLLDRDRLLPGDTAVAQLRLDAAVAVPAREAFVLRLASPARTIGGGVVLDPCPPRRRAGDAAPLAALAAAPPMAAAALRLREAGTRGCDTAALARLAALSPASFLPRLAEAEGVRLVGGLALHRDACTSLEHAVLAAVEAAQRQDPVGPGADFAALRPALPPGAPAEAIVARLVAAGSLTLAGGRLKRRGLDAAALLSDADRALLAELEGAFRTGHLAPPDAAAVIAGCRRRAAALHLLQRQGVLLRAPDAVQKREILFHRDAVAAARDLLHAHFGRSAEGFLAGECGRLLGISRRFSIPLLERLDAERFTRRAGDRRHINAEPAATRRV
jgi:selenocysteine-specific elongation factor